MLRQLTTSALLLGFVATLSLAGTSCSSEGDDPVVIPEEDLSSVNQLSQADRIFFLKRTHFGFKQSELQRLNQLGYEDYLDWMLTLQQDPQLEAQALAENVADPDFPSTTEIARWWEWLMVHNPNPFQEVLAMFWHDRFATSDEVLDAQSMFWMFDHLNLFRFHGADDLANLLHLMAIDWTMLIWLDGYVSTANAPNENFAREFWELFTLGADNGYTQADIVEASRAFTGYRRILEPNRAGSGRDQFVMVFQQSRHDNTSKDIFGQTLYGNGQAEYRDMVDLTLANRPVAEFICTKIWEHFVYLNPSPALVAQLSDGFRATNYDLKALFKRIFLSKAFFSDRAKEGLIKSPVEHHIGFMRSTGLELFPSRIDASLRDSAQRPSQPPTVNGWPSGEFWLSSQAMVERANFLRDCVYYSHEAPQNGYDVGVELVPANKTSDAEVVDHLAWLLQVELENGQRQVCIDYLNTDRNGTGNFADPWDFNDPVDRDKKIRGLLYILGQHPTYQIR
ncbi:MAG: DUF1800 domain-containing protein [Planctomycetes bacterium]|nr:DUF1800 domain-containing protein [Planctomycetota bacterium]MCB9935924.1 DUF1800 domain-containing protein [Planctomycetota bacterium]